MKIALSIEETWPQRVRDLLDAALEVLWGFERERKRIDAEAEKDILLSIRRPSNPYQGARDETLQQINYLLQDVRLLGYHCTRLTEDEISSIRSTGLRPLSPDLVRERIDRIVASGKITADVGARMSVGSLANDTSRRGLVWFALATELLRDDSGVGPLFRSWGGEAVYRGTNPPGATLRQLGTPCIIEAWIPRLTLCLYTDLAKVLAARYLKRQGIAADDVTEIAGNVRVPITVHRIIQRHAPEFEQLTGCSGWREPLT